LQIKFSDEFFLSKVSLLLNSTVVKYYCIKDVVNSREKENGGQFSLMMSPDLTFQITIGVFII
jgi:hypothetical protein